MSDSEALIDRLLAPPTTDRSLRRFPQQVGRAIGLTWQSSRGPLLLVTGLQLLSGAGAAGQVLVARHLLGVILGERSRLTVGAALPSIAVLAVLTIAVRLAAVVAGEVSRVMSGRVEAHAMCEVADATAGADLLDFERPAFHDLLLRAQTAASSRPVQMVNGLTSWLGASATVVGVGAVLLTLEPLLVPLLVLGAVPVWITSRRASAALYRFALAQTGNERQRHYTFLLLTHRDFAAEQRSYGLHGFFRARLADLYATWLSAMAALVRRRILVSAIGGTIAAGLTLATLVLLVWLIAHGHLALSAAGAAAAAVVLLGEQLHGLSSGSGTLYENTLYMQDFTTFVARWGARRQPPGGTPLPAFTRLQAVDVRFTYPSRDVPALDGVSVEIGQGEVVALVGENGSGKTTLAKVLAGLYPPDSGHVLWDGVDLATVEPDRIRRATAVIFQEFGEYWMSAADNIAMGDVERMADRQAVVSAAQQAQADGFIAALPHGFDNLLGSEYFGGANLSLGQWQRVALARAYFRDAPFVILDEPTASLDPRAEAALFASIRTLYRGRSVLLISHRFASARAADRIYVLESGRIIESGSHEALMAAGGWYAEMFRLQAAAYNLAPSTD